MKWYHLKDKALLKRDILFFWQRVTRGWDDSSTWSMDQSLAKIILPRLKRFQEIRRGYPHDMTDEEWDKIIKEMIWGFQWFADGKQYSYEPKDGAAEAKRAHDAIELFAKYYSGLWW